MIHVGDCLEILRTLPDRSCQCCVTSPPYFGLRDYGLPPTHWPAVEFVPMAGLPPVHIPAMACCLGLETDPLAFIAHLVHVFRAVRPVLADDGVLWLNLGDSYNAYNANRGTRSDYAGDRVRFESIFQSGYGLVAKGLKQKDLLGIPWRVAFALQADGWYLRQDVIWHKPNPMPESVKDRCTKAHEYLFLLTKSPRYYFDADAIAEARTQDEDAAGFRGGAYCGGEIDNATMGKRKSVGNTKRGLPPRHAQYESSDQSGLDTVGRGMGRNKRSVWTVATRPFPEAHFATFPPELIRPCILAGSRPGDTILDPFGGAGTTALVAEQEGRDWVACELNPEYAEIAERRLSGVQRRLIA